MFRSWTISIFLVIVLPATAKSNCGVLDGQSPPTELISFLRVSQALLPAQQDRVCITFAIQHLESKPSPEAIAVLIDYLDFERPLSESEQKGCMLHGPPTLPSSNYPAPGSLFSFGKAAVPALLSVIETSRSGTRRRNAIFAIMQVFRDEPMNGIEVIKQRTTELEPSNAANLRSAAREAVQWCGDHYQQRCRAAASKDIQ